jgi:hypothetical protein
VATVGVEMMLSAPRISDAESLGEDNESFDGFEECFRRHVGRCLDVFGEADLDFAQ